MVEHDGVVVLNQPNGITDDDVMIRRRGKESKLSVRKTTKNNALTNDVTQQSTAVESRTSKEPVCATSSSSGDVTGGTSTNNSATIVKVSGIADSFVSKKYLH